MFSDATLNNVKSYARSYREADPFPFVVIDDFLQEPFAEQLLADFPVTSEASKTNEFGKKGPKTVNHNMKDVSEAYARLCEFMVSDEFVRLIGKITGIKGLISLPNEAGGTHENRNKSVLAPHLDYNYFGERSPLHRRLNVLLYLNKNWDPAWGGNLQLHSNPREWDENRIVANSPDFNRCIIMETSERSWHGFDKIKVPEGISRKSISIYMFSEDRPREEIAPRHSTFYVQPPISDRFKAGLTMTPADAGELRQAMKKRDNWIHFYQREALRHSGKAEAQLGRAQRLEETIETALAALEKGDQRSAKKRLRAILDEKARSEQAGR